MSDLVGVAERKRLIALDGFVSDYGSLESPMTARLETVAPFDWCYTAAHQPRGDGDSRR